MVQEKDLGVIVDPDLTSAKYVETKVNKANKLLRLIMQAKLPPTQLCL